MFNNPLGERGVPSTIQGGQSATQIRRPHIHYPGEGLATGQSTFPYNKKGILNPGGKYLAS